MLWRDGGRFRLKPTTPALSRGRNEIRARSAAHRQSSRRQPNRIGRVARAQVKNSISAQITLIGVEPLHRIRQSVVIAMASGLQNALSSIRRVCLYAGAAFQQLLKDHGMTCSMSRKGDCWDNVVVVRRWRRDDAREVAMFVGFAHVKRALRASNSGSRNAECRSNSASIGLLRAGGK
jgi:transposase InsO family protein